MKTFSVACLLAGLACGIAAAQDGQPERGSDRRWDRPGQERSGFSDRYAVVLENNIFLRERRTQRQSSTQSTTQPQAPPRPEKEWVLVGVVFEEGAFRAYFESLTGGGVKRAVVGDQIAEGALSEVYIDAVGYMTGDGVTWISVGQDLTGEYIVIPGSAGPTAAAPSTAPSPGAAPAAASPATLSIEERLRQRRMQEAGGSRGSPPPSEPDPPLPAPESPEPVEPDSARPPPEIRVIEKSQLGELPAGKPIERVPPPDLPRL
jgi:hypothetical protein